MVEKLCTETTAVEIQILLLAMKILIGRSIANTVLRELVNSIVNSSLG